MLRRSSVSATALALLGLGVFVATRDALPKQRHVGPALVGDPDYVGELYAKWKEGRAAYGTAGELDLGLAWSRALSTERTPARGHAKVDANRRTIDVEVDGMPAGERFDAWIVDNERGKSAAPEVGDRMARLGTLGESGGKAALHVDLEKADLVGFDVDLVVLTRAGLSPDRSVILAGMPGLFERLESRERASERALADRAPSGFLLAAMAPAPALAPAMIAPPLFADLVAYGEDLFFHETFSGNGRTCGTCHPAENNFTIEPAFIATLPDDDPLFVAEFNPDLNPNTNGGLPFENPVLMRGFGLILENLDGFDDLRYRFTMRSVPHTLGMSQSITSPDPAGVKPEQRTGWSGDGAPGQGTLREFALGAVRQHFTRTMLRQPGVDFVFPNDDELDALEAFQLSLGRHAELDIATLSLKDANADAGRLAFDANRCTRCHENAGANEGAVNVNRNTGVEAFTRHNPDGTGEPRPPDGGLGTNGAGGFDTVVATPEPDDPSVLSFGNKTFNVTSLVEFADTLPAFHSNITNMGSLPDTVEGAVEFYRSAEFQNSPDGFVISFGPNDIENIGKFLRVINALENRRSANAYGKRAAVLIGNGGYDPAAVERLLTLAQADCKDAIEELSAVGLHVNDAVHGFAKAIVLFENAKSGSDASRLANIEEARNQKLEFARASMQN